ncbi:DUF305 domain-containing protein [Actinoplanes sp. NPDC051411]|uniref:DUF305 domain-containing protein n=1 Tax=Actinoplanes sp. NPDC051411 TaxID=3155522 RepID=UPI0034141E08
MRRSSSFVAAILCAAALAACDTAAPAASGPPPAGPEHNAADVAFVEALIPHHQAGIELAQRVAEQPDHRVLAEAIISTERDEITRMTGWLTLWGVTPSPKSAKPLPTGDPVKALAAHQEEAIALAQTEQAQGSNRAALDFAKEVIESRTAEASELKPAR